MAKFNQTTERSNIDSKYALHIELNRIFVLSANKLINLNSFLIKFNINCNLRTILRLSDVKCKYFKREQNNFYAH